jgi:hypothetical protein
LLSSLVAKNFTVKIDKWDDWGSNPNPRIYNVLFLPTELNLRDVIDMFYMGLKMNSKYL